MRKRRKKFQQEERERNAKEQATSKQQAASVKQQAIEESVPYTDVIEANGDSDKSDS